MDNYTEIISVLFIIAFALCIVWLIFTIRQRKGAQFS